LSLGIQEQSQYKQKAEISPELDGALRDEGIPTKFQKFKEESDSLQMRAGTTKNPSLN
jgi:hypothetical protein